MTDGIHIKLKEQQNETTVFRALNSGGITLKERVISQKVKTVANFWKRALMTESEHTRNLGHDGNVQVLVHGCSYKGV